jgi:UDP-N-acetylmuramate-alanine ligase
MVEEIKKNGRPAYLARTFEEAAKKAQTLSGKGDMILTLGAGETNKVADILITL